MVTMAAGPSESQDQNDGTPTGTAIPGNGGHLFGAAAEPSDNSIKTPSIVY
jgi:hypothetical protein